MSWRFTHNRRLCAALSTAMALVLLVLYARVCYGAWVWEIYLPTTLWSDEVVYGKQLAAVMRFGAPQGYFGFNESRAELGTFAAWGPAVFYLYALPGLIFRGRNAFIACNLLWAAAGWYVFVRGTRISWRRQLVFAAVLACLSAPIRYVFSAMQEPIHYAAVLALVGLGAAVRRGTRHARAAWWALCAVCFAETLVRPYNAVLWLYPFVLAVPCSRRRAAGAVCGAGISALGTVVLMKKFYAPYFFSNVDWEPFYRLAHGQVLSAAAYVLQKLGLAAQGIGEELASSLRGDGGGYYLSFLLLVAAVAVCLVWDAAHKRPLFWKACALSVSAVVFLALMLLYRTTETARHTLVLSLLLLTALLLENARPCVGAAAAAAALWAAGILCLTPRSSYALPRYDAARDAELNAVAAVLSECEAQNTSDDPWTHTLAYAFMDEAPVGLLYAVPDGMGLQFDENTYLSDTTHEIYARYVMTSPDAATALRLENEGWTLLYESTDCALYVRAE